MGGVVEMKIDGRQGEANVQVMSALYTIVYGLDGTKGSL